MPTPLLRQERSCPHNHYVRGSCPHKGYVRRDPVHTTITSGEILSTQPLRQARSCPHNHYVREILSTHPLRQGDHVHNPLRQGDPAHTTITSGEILSTHPLRQGNPVHTSITSGEILSTHPLRQTRSCPHYHYVRGDPAVTAKVTVADFNNSNDNNTSIPRTVEAPTVHPNIIQCSCVLVFALGHEE